MPSGGDEMRAAYCSDESLRNCAMTSPSDDLKTELRAVAEAAADAARVETLRHFRTSVLTAESKRAEFDPVTVADRAAEIAIRRVIGSRRPNDAILGEEHSATAGTSGLTWVVDPIDGTRGYLCGTPTWGTLIAVSDAERPILGLVDQPYVDERFIGGFGRAECIGPRGRSALRSRAPRPLAEAFLFTTFPEVGTDDERRAFRRLANRVRLTRYGMDCYAYALVAAGQVDLVVEAGLQPYDVHAPIALIEAAGGIVTDWAGGPAHRGGRVLAAANAEIHAAALAVLAGAE
jgi:histidinol phosphatase-like enzyme (inositol monophosphatase family)